MGRKNNDSFSRNLLESLHVTLLLLLTIRFPLLKRQALTGAWAEPPPWATPLQGSSSPCTASWALASHCQSGQRIAQAHLKSLGPEFSRRDQREEGWEVLTGPFLHFTLEG